MNFADILNELEIPFVEEGEHHHTRSGWIQIDCPFCAGAGAEKWHCGYNLAYGYMNCWRCGKLKTAHVLVSASGESYKNVLELLKGLPLEEAPRERRTGKLELPPYRDKLQDYHKKYLYNRGLHNTHRLCKLWGLEGFPGYGDFKWRIFIPIHHNGEVVSWTTRSLGDEGLRYRSAEPHQEKYFHKDLLYGEDYVRDTIIVCEGPVDVWTIGPGAVATFGLTYSSTQLARIARYTSRVICFDNEPDAQRVARRLCSDLEGFDGKTYNVVLGGKDANSSPKKEIRELRKRFLDV